jgi:dienelactone hydrolase
LKDPIMIKLPQTRSASSLTPVFASMVAAYLAMGMAQPAQADGFERGPAPTIETLQAAAGPYALDTYQISRAAAGSYGYGGATVYFPKALLAGGQRFGVVTFTPGFTGTQSVYAPLAAKIASHGFVVVNIDTVTTFDQPPQRATQMMGAMRQIVAMAKAGSAPFAKVADVERRAVVGHSMGGGGTLIAATAHDGLKAAVAFTPWSMTKNFSGDQVPTMIVACEKDSIAVNTQHSDVFYASLNARLPRAEVEVKDAGHMCATAGGSAAAQATVVKSAVAWLKLHLDEDQRYLPLLVNGGLNVGDYSRYDVKGL